MLRESECEHADIGGTAVRTIHGDCGQQCREGVRRPVVIKAPSKGGWWWYAQPWSQEKVITNENLRNGKKATAWNTLCRHVEHTSGAFKTQQGVNHWDVVCARANWPTCADCKVVLEALAKQYTCDDFMLRANGRHRAEKQIAYGVGWGKYRKAAEGRPAGQAL